MGADRRAAGEEQRQRREIVVIAGALEIAVEHHIGETLEVRMDKVHQQEGEIIKYVDHRDRVTEFNGVEQRGLAVVKTDIAQMQIAVTAPHPAQSQSRIEQRFEPRQRRIRRRPRPRQLAWQSPLSCHG